MKKYFLILFIILFSGCASIEYQSLDVKSKINKDTSILLIAAIGNRDAQYLQFIANKFPPAMNYREILNTSDIIALKVDTPMESVDLHVITTGQAGYIPIGSSVVSYGYKRIIAEPIDIPKKGIYFYGVLNTDSLIVNHKINKKFIDIAKEKYGEYFELLELEPINFKW